MIGARLGHGQRFILRRQEIFCYLQRLAATLGIASQNPGRRFKVCQVTFALLAQLLTKLQGRFEPLFGPSANLIPKNMNFFSATFAAVPFELYLQTCDARYLSIGTKIADQQWAPPALWGLSSQPRYWIVDEPYLITIAQVLAFRATGNPVYISRAAREIIAYIEKLQQPHGLFYHAERAPHFWARGNGWVAAGMSEVLRSLPENHEYRPRILESYQAMMTRLVQYQGENGLWRQLVDHPEAWPETSGSAMFTFALATGIKKGWVDARTYAPAARKGWLGLTEYINAEGDIAEVSEGTYISNELQYYLNRQRAVGDLHGQAPVLWSAAAVLSSVVKQ